MWTVIELSIVCALRGGVRTTTKFVCAELRLSARLSMDEVPTRTLLHTLPYTCNAVRQIWTVANDPGTGKEIYQTSMGKFGKAAVSDVLSACFINAGVGHGSRAACSCYSFETAGLRA
eukprot:352788-Chlamydomonas_euryale.AAC.2